MKRGEGKLLYYRTEDGKTELQVKGTIVETIAEIGQLVHLVHIKTSCQDLFGGFEIEKVMRDPKFWDKVFEIRPEDQIISEKFTRPKKEGDKT